MPVTVLLPSTSSTPAEQSNSEDVSLSMPGRAATMSALSYAAEHTTLSGT